MGEFQRFATVVIKGAAIFLMLISPLLFYNIVVDPYGIFFNRANRSRLEPNLKYIKLKYLLKNPDHYQSFIFGSSRVGSLNPKEIPEDNYFNMTYSNGLPKDHYANVKMLIENGVKIKNLLIGIDFLSLLENPDISDNDLLRKSYPISLSEKFNFYKSYIIFRPDWRVIKLTLPYFLDDNSNRSTTRAAITNPQDLFIDQNPLTHITSIDLSCPHSVYIDNPNIVKAMKEIDNLVQFAKAHRIKIRIFINPTHHLTYINLNLDSYYEALKRLATITDFIDFSGMNSITMNNYYYYEPSHYRKCAGDMIIARIFSKPGITLPDDFGIYVNKSNVDDHILKSRKIVNDYLKSTCLESKYVAPINLSDYRMLGKTSEVFIEKINGLDINDENDSMLISTPLITIKGRSSIKGSKENGQRIFVQIGDHLFEGKYENESVGQIHPSGLLASSYREWNVLIPITMLNSGEQVLKAVILNMKITGYLLSDQDIKVIINNNLILPKIDSLTLLKGKPNFCIDYINGLNPGSFNILFNTQSSINIVGWAIDDITKSRSGGVIVSLDGTPYINQFTCMREDVSDHFQMKNTTYTGWGISMPVTNLSEGPHVLTFRVLNNQRNGYYSVASHVHFQYVKIASGDFLNGIEMSDEKTKFYIDAINGITVNSSMKIDSINDPIIQITGWAVDLPNEQPAAEVYVEIDGVMFKAHYGLCRPDVAKYLNNNVYLNCGWRLELPVSMVGVRGAHQLCLKILSKSKSMFYDSGQCVEFKTK